MFNIMHTHISVSQGALLWEASKTSPVLLLAFLGWYETRARAIWGGLDYVVCNFPFVPTAVQGVVLAAAPFTSLWLESSHLHPLFRKSQNVLLLTTCWLAERVTTQKSCISGIWDNGPLPCFRTGEAQIHMLWSSWSLWEVLTSWRWYPNEQGKCSDERSPWEGSWDRK